MDILRSWPLVETSTESEASCDSKDGIDRLRALDLRHSERLGGGNIQCLAAGDIQSTLAARYSLKKKWEDVVIWSDFTANQKVFLVQFFGYLWMIGASWHSFTIPMTLCCLQLFQPSWTSPQRGKWSKSWSTTWVPSLAFTCTKSSGAPWCCS